MKIYIDLVFITNLFFDFVLLFTVSRILKRNASFKRLLLGAFIGSIAILFLFININKLELFLYKNLIAILMVISSFDYKDIRYTFKNIIYLYLVSIVLAGSIYLLNLEFSTYVKGLVFYNNGLSINIILMILISPIIVFNYIKLNKDISNKYSLYYNVDIYFKNNENITLIGYYDTGNNLIDPYKKRLIILVDYNKIKNYVSNEKILLVPYKKLNTEDILNCVRIKKIIVNSNEYNNILVGLSYDDICIDGVDCILNNKMEGLC